MSPDIVVRLRSWQWGEGVVEGGPETDSREEVKNDEETVLQRIVEENLNIL